MINMTSANPPEISTVLPVLAVALNDEQSAVRVRAADLIYTVTNAAATPSRTIEMLHQLMPQILPRLRDDNPDVRGSAMLALTGFAQLKDERILEAAYSGIGSQNIEVQEAAFYALYKGLPNLDVTRTAARSLSSRATRSQTRILALGYIGLNPNDEDLEIVGSALDDRDAAVRLKAISILGSFGPRISSGMTEKLEKLRDQSSEHADVRSAASEALQRRKQ